MNRRRFIYNSSIASLSVLGLNSCSQLLRDIKITILHSNDVHSQIEPFPLNHDRFPNRGGFARRASIFDGVRSVNPNTLIFDAGDIFQGTPYFNFFKGELELKLMKEMGYNAATGPDTTPQQQHFAPVSAVSVSRLPKQLLAQL